MVRHLQQVEMAYLKKDAMYAKIGSTKVTSVHSKTMELLRKDKIRKTCQL